MLIEQYFDKLRARIEAIAADTEPIRKAAEICAGVLSRGGMIHVFDSGHLVSHELINRAGGLLAISRLEFSLNINNLVKARADQPPAPGNALSLGYIQHVFESNQLRPGDVLFVGSVSGKTSNVVEVAIQGGNRAVWCFPGGIEDVAGVSHTVAC